MFIDTSLRVSAAQVVTSTAVSTNSIDTSLITNTMRDLGAGDNVVYFHFTWSGGSGGPPATVTPTTATVTFQIIGTSDNALTTNLVVFAATDAILGSAMVVDVALSGLGNTLPMALDLPVQIRRLFVGSTLPRYLGARYVVASGPLTNSSAFTADLILDPQDGRKFMPAGFTVS